MVMRGDGYEPCLLFRCTNRTSLHPCWSSMSRENDFQFFFLSLTLMFPTKNNIKIYTLSSDILTDFKKNLKRDRTFQLCFYQSQFNTMNCDIFFVYYCWLNVYTRTHIPYDYRRVIKCCYTHEHNNLFGVFTPFMNRILYTK